MLVVVKYKKSWLLGDIMQLADCINVSNALLILFRYNFYTLEIQIMHGFAAHVL